MPRKCATLWQPGRGVLREARRGLTILAIVLGLVASGSGGRVPVPTPTPMPTPTPTPTPTEKSANPGIPGETTTFVPTIPGHDQAGGR